MDEQKTQREEQKTARDATLRDEAVEDLEPDEQQSDAVSGGAVTPTPTRLDPYKNF